MIKDEDGFSDFKSRCSFKDNSTKTHMICILTVGHKRFDTRIWVKEIASIKAAGVSVNYFVADGAGDEVVDGIHIRDFGPIPERSGFKRRMKLMYGMVRKSGFKKGDVIHFHDGIFLPFAFLLWVQGCKLIYDVHEDFPRQVLNSRFKMPIKRIWSWSISLMEWLAGKAFCGFIVATPVIAARFPTQKTITVQNFPLTNEWQEANPADWGQRALRIAYVGGLSIPRGAREMVGAIYLAAKKIEGVRLAFAGSCSPESLREELMTMPGWAAVDDLGWLGREEIVSLLGDVRVGLVLLHPTKNYTEAYPVKLFEYMAAGIPVIASNFPLWREIVKESNCGLLVDPLNPNEIADAICWLLEHPQDAEKMGRNGMEAVERKYNWANEEAKLLDFYRGELMVQA